MQKRNISLITQNDLCVGCGACKYACAYDEIDIVLNHRKGFYEPVIRNPLTCLDCETQPCLHVCPGYEEDFVRLANWQDATQQIGPWHAIYTGYSSTPDIRLRASSGGIIREICRYCLEQGLVDGVLALRHQDGMDYTPDVYCSPQDVVHMPGSIYHSVPFARAFELLQTIPGRFLLVATPCQLTAIRKWQAVCQQEMAGSIALTVGLMCGWTLSRHTVHHFCQAMGIDDTRLTNATYRGGSTFGAFRLEVPEGSYVFTRRPVYLQHAHMVPYTIAFSRTYNSKRCLLCVEHINYLADIVVGDAWLQRFAHDEVGTNIIISRQHAASTLLQTMMAQGRIILHAATEEDALVSQRYHVKLTTALKLVNKLNAQGKFVPTYRIPITNTAMPGFWLWYKNYLNPLLFRFLTWHGLGYAWFQVRRLLFHVIFPVKAIVKLIKNMVVGFFVRLRRRKKPTNGI
jgi:coenzyme F420 hydrogenase subunit beta